MSFDRLAPHYRSLEVLLAGRVLQRAREAHLVALRGAREILLLGEGPGRLLETIVRSHIDARITVVDSSQAMLDQAARHIGDAGQQVHWIHADLREWSPPRAQYDAVATSCVLDCFDAPMLARLIPNWAAALRPDATWLYVDFALPARGWRRYRARVIHAWMYVVFRRITAIEARAVTPPDRWLKEAGFRRHALAEFSAGLIRSEWWQRGRCTHSEIAEPADRSANDAASSTVSSAALVTRVATRT